MKDTQKELDRLEQELLAEELQPEEENVDLDEALLTEVLSEFSEPKFDGIEEFRDPQDKDPDEFRDPEDGAPDQFRDPEDVQAYSNYANDYDEALQNLAQTGETEPQIKNNDKLIMGLMIVVCALCVGIIGFLIYWLNAFLI